MPLNIMQRLAVSVSSSVMGYGSNQHRLSLVAQRVAGGSNKASWPFSLYQNRPNPTLGRRANQHAGEADVFTIWASPLLA